MTRGRPEPGGAAAAAPPGAPRLQRSAVAGIGLRLVLVVPLLVWLAQTWGPHYVQAWLPWYRAVLELALPAYDVSSLELVWQRGQWRIAATFVSERLLVVHGRLLPTGASVSASTLMSHALLHPLVLVAAALAWPGLRWRARLERLLLSLPLLLLLATLDVPLALASSVVDLVSWMASPAADAASWRVDWVRVLDGGGRVALCIAAAFGAAGLHAWLRRNGLA